MKLPFHEFFASKVAGNQRLSTVERSAIRAEYARHAPGVNQQSVYIGFYLEPRETVIGHLLHVWNVGWLAAYYSGAESTPGIVIRVLDVGAGEGWLFNVLTSMRVAKGTKIVYTGIELNLERVEIFQMMNPLPVDSPHRMRVSDFRSDALLLDDDNMQDVVVSSESLEHVTKEEGVTLLRDMFDALLPGGFLILTTPDVDWLGVGKRGPYHLHEWGVEELRGELAAAGFVELDQFWLYGRLADVQQFIPRDARKRLSTEWLRGALTPAAGTKGGVQVHVCQKPKSGVRDEKIFSARGKKGAK